MESGSVVPSSRMRGNRLKLNKLNITGINWNKLKHRRFCLNQETLFDCEGDQALSQVAQEDCESCRYTKILGIFGDIKKGSGHDCGNLVLGSLAWIGWLDNTTSRDAFQTQLFCDSMSVFIRLFSQVRCGISLDMEISAFSPKFFSLKLPHGFLAWSHL